MDFELFFCADGILRTKLENSKQFLPLQFLQEKSMDKNNHLRFLSKWWSCNTHFEEGLTVANFLNGLKPWHNFFSDLTNKDILAYINESKKPVLVNEEKSSIDWIDLSFVTELIPVKNYINDDQKELDLQEWLNSSHDVQFNGEWKIENKYNLNGYSNENESQYSIEEIPINELANTHIYLNNKHIIYVYNHLIDSLLSSENKLFNTKGLGVRKLSNSYNESTLDYIQAEKKHSLQDVIKGFFNNFSVNPKVRDQSNEQFLAIMLDRINEFNEMDKVVDLQKFKKEKEQPAKKLRGQVSINVFSGMIADLEEKHNYWNEMIHEANVSNIIHKIGKIKEQKYPQNRVLGYIVENADLSSPIIKD